MAGQHSDPQPFIAQASAQLQACGCMIDGASFEALQGETVAGLLIRTGSTGSLSYFCGMGACFECLVVVDGRRIQACLTPVSEGMEIECLVAEAYVGR